MAVDSYGRLIPCCSCDHPSAIKGDADNYIKLLDVSYIDQYDSIIDILYTPEWIRFEQDLHNSIAPNCCWRICGKDIVYKEETFIDTKGNVRKVNND